MVFTTEGFSEVAIESWPEWDLNPRPLNSVYIYIYIYIYACAYINLTRANSLADFLYMLQIIRQWWIPEGTILCAIGVVGLYPNISHDEGLVLLKDSLNSRVDK